MLKARMKNGQVIFGLSEENLERLKKGKPIVFNMSELAMPACPVMIFYGKTEASMVAELEKAGGFLDSGMTKPGGKLNG